MSPQTLTPLAPLSHDWERGEPSAPPARAESPLSRFRERGLGVRAVCLLAVLPLLLACSPEPAETDESETGPAPPVEALQARQGTLPLEERLHGVVKAQNQVAIRTEIEARVIEVLVRSGDAVEKGQPLVRLEDDTLQDRLRQAEADFRLAEATAREAQAQVAELEAQVKRTRALAAEDLVSDAELETQEARLEAARARAGQAQARVEQAQATVQERRSALSKTLVRSPVAGRVGQRNAEVGMVVGPGDLLFLVGNLDELRVEIPLTEAMLGYVEEGLPVRVTSPSLKGEPIRASLSRISPFLEESSFSTLGEIDLDNRDGRLRPGMFVSVDVLYGESERATLVPASAVWDDPRTGERGVYVVTGGSVDTASLDEPRDVALRDVEILAEGAGTVGITGVEPDEWVVVVGQHLLARDEAETARVRPTTWERVLELQDLQREDLLEGFLERQREYARSRGAVPPSNEEYLAKGG